MGAKAHYALNPGAVVPAPIEDDDFAAGGHFFDVTLSMKLGLLSVGRRRQSNQTKHTRADALQNALNDSAFAGGVAPFEDDDDAGMSRLYPLLKLYEFDLQPEEFDLVLLVWHLLLAVVGHLETADVVSPIH